MGFKLGSERGNHAINGELKTKLNFVRKSQDSASVPGVPIIRKKLEEGIMGEANMDGSIYISEDVTPGSAQEREVLNHEMRHATDMKVGKLKYSDDDIKYDGITFPRKTINGRDMIHYNGKWVEAGSKKFPWELDANNGNK